MPAASAYVQGLWPSEHGDGRDDLRQDPHPASSLAGRGLVPDQPEAGRQRLGLQRVLGLGSYQTAWAMLHRFRRAMVRPDRDRLKGVPFVQASVEPGTQVRTDGSAAYRSLASLGYAHQRNVMLGADEPAHVTLAGVHRVASLVKRWILGTHHGAVQPEHLDAYLDEFVFRFNRRTSGSRGMLFYRLLQQAVVTDPVTYADIVVPEPEQVESA